MPIQTQIDQGETLVTYTLTGQVSADEIVQVLEQYWQAARPIPNVLWKGEAGASIAHLSGDDLRKVATVVQGFRDRAENRKGGKSAIVAKADIDFGLSRVIEALHRNLQPSLPYEIRVFRTEAEALTWFGER